MTTFTTKNDLRNWVDTMTSDWLNRPEGMVEKIATKIQNDSDRPNWGWEDWTEYLDGVDLTALCTFTATFRLGQDSGVQGPSKTVEVESEQHAKELAVEWSLGQLGHPWDAVTIEIPELDSTIEIRDGATVKE
jgi:hypothetical protein